MATCGAEVIVAHQCDRARAQDGDRFLERADAISDDLNKAPHKTGITEPLIMALKSFGQLVNCSVLIERCSGFGTPPCLGCDIHATERSNVNAEPRRVDKTREFIQEGAIALRSAREVHPDKPRTFWSEMLRHASQECANEI